MKMVFGNLSTTRGVLFATGMTLVTGAAVGCSDAPAAQPNDTKATAHAPSSTFAWTAVSDATTLPIDEGPARLIQVTGTEAVVVPHMPAHVRRLLVKPGDRVEADAAIAEVIMPDIDVAAASLTAARNAIEILAARRERLAALAKNGLVRGAELSTIDLELAQHHADRLRAQAVLSGAGLSRGGLVTLRSPIAGVVTEMPATLGQLRRPEDGPIARIRSATGQRVEAVFAEKLLPDARFALVTADGETEVQLVNDIVAPSGFGRLAWFEAPPDVTIEFSGQGRVRAYLPADTPAFAVPAKAVGTRDSAQYIVTRAKDGATAPIVVTVEVLRVAHGNAIVTGSLGANVLVALDPLLAATDTEGEQP